VEWFETDKHLRFVQAKYTAAFLLVLGNPVRVRLIELLADGQERTIDQLAALVNVDLPNAPGVIYNADTASAAAIGRHLGVLYRGAVVGWRRQGNRSYYWLLEPRAAELCRLAAAVSPAKRSPGGRAPDAEPGAAADGGA
jgi:DNA-binding transcriptional ArsR family regulator